MGNAGYLGIPFEEDSTSQFNCLDHYHPAVVDNSEHSIWGELIGYIGNYACAVQELGHPDAQLTSSLASQRGTSTLLIKGYSGDTTSPPSDSRLHRPRLRLGMKRQIWTFDCWGETVVGSGSGAEKEFK